MSGRQVSGKPVWSFRVISRFECDRKRTTGKQGLGKSPARLVDPGNLDTACVPLDEQPDRTGGEIDCRECRVVARKHRAPDRIHGVVRRYQADRRMSLKAYARLIGFRDTGELRERQWLAVGGAQGAADGPFEARHVGQIDKGRRRFEASQKFRETGTIDLEPCGVRRLIGDERVSRGGEEIVTNKALHGRIGRSPPP